ncbi:MULTISPECIES: MFS transporter [Streptomyces]|uniref:MFS transporter n=1 Tax=Streptomyces lycopersici TaxID=2974589 RepID=UPI0021D11BF0|nr:MFS transporter [Streptomyces sp. NEAU-383]
MAVVALHRNAAYRWLWISYTLSSIGTLASFASLPLLVLHSFDSPAAVGLVSFAGAAVLLLAMPWAGLFVDRVGWREVMIGSDLIRAAAMALLTLCIAGDQLSLSLVLAVTVVNSALSVPFMSATGAALRASVEATQLSTALALNQGRTAVIGILGPVGGTALYAYSHGLPFAVDAASFLLSALCVCAMGATAEVPATRPGLRWPDVTAGWRFLRGHPFLRYMALNVIVMDFSINGVVLVLVVNSSADGGSLGAGVVMAVAGAGNLLGSTVALTAMRRVRLRTLVLILVWVAAVCTPLIAAHGGMLWGAALVGATCVTVPIVAVLTNTKVLEETPTHLLGRVQSVFQTVPRLVAATGPACAGVLLSLLPAPAVLLLFAVPLAALAVHSTGLPALRASES